MSGAHFWVMWHQNGENGTKEIPISVSASSKCLCLLLMKVWPKLSDRTGICSAQMESSVNLTKTAVNVQH